MLKLPKAIITHTVNGRLRIKVPLEKGNNRYFQALEHKLSRCDGVHSIKTNSITGSVLLLYEADKKENIFKFAEENRLFKLQGHESVRMLLIDRVRHSFKDLNRYTKKLTGDELDIASFTFLSLLFLSIYKIVRGNFFAPAWYTSLWYAINTIIRSSDNR